MLFFGKQGTSTCEFFRYEKMYTLYQFVEFSTLKALEFFGCRDFLQKNSIHVNSRSTMEKIEEKLSHRTNL